MKHISGRRKLVPFAGLTTGRYRQLRVTEGEPSLGFVTEKTLPLNEDYYQLVTYGEGEIPVMIPAGATCQYLSLISPSP